MSQIDCTLSDSAIFHCPTCKHLNIIKNAYKILPNDFYCQNCGITVLVLTAKQAMKTRVIVDNRMLQMINPVINDISKSDPWLIVSNLISNGFTLHEITTMKDVIKVQQNVYKLAFMVDERCYMKNRLNFGCKTIECLRKGGKAKDFLIEIVKEESLIESLMLIVWIVLEDSYRRCKVENVKIEDFLEVMSKIQPNCVAFKPLFTMSKL